MNSTQRIAIQLGLALIELEDTRDQLEAVKKELLAAKEELAKLTDKK